MYGIFPSYCGANYLNMDLLRTRFQDMSLEHLIITLYAIHAIQVFACHNHKSSQKIRFQYLWYFKESC